MKQLPTLKFFIVLSLVIFCCNPNNLALADEGLKPNLSGKWKWQGVQDQQVILFGEMNLKDDGRNITGERKRLVPGRSGDLTKAVDTEIETLSGKWVGKYAFQLEIKNKNGNITKALLLTNENAKRIEGNLQELVKSNGDSFEVSTSRGSSITKKLGKNFKLTYELTAVRTK